MNKPYKEVVIVDQNNAVVGSANLVTAIENNLLRRVVRIFVKNEQEQFLLQKRSQRVFKPGLYDVSAGGHVDVGESYQDAAHRELREELGITASLPNPIISDYRHPSESSFFNVYIITIATDTPIIFDDQEIELVIWKSAKEIDEMITATPELCTPALTTTWSLLPK